MTRRLLKQLLVGMTLALCAPAHAEEPKHGGTLTYAVAGSLENYDCHAAQSFVFLHHLAPHYSTLLKIDPTNYPSVVGDLADSWTISDDKLTYTFKLHEGVKFHDGTTLTADDIKASWERLRNPPEGVFSARKREFGDIKSIDVVDPLTVRFTLSGVNESMLSVFAGPWNCIYSAARLAQDPQYPAHNVMGTGPFKFVEHVQGSHWTGERFADYFVKGKPYLDGFRALTMTSQGVVTAFSGGQIDAEFRGLSPAEVSRVLAAQPDRYNVVTGEGSALYLVAFNTQKKPFDDERVRRALSMAIDRWGGAEPLSRISAVKNVSAYLRSGAELAMPVDTLVKMPGFSKDIEASRAEAKRLLAEAGVPNLKIQLMNRGPANPYSPLALYVIDQWRRIGVQADQVVLDIPAWIARRKSGEFDAVIDSYAEFTDDPTFPLSRYLSQAVSGNTARFSDPEVDRLYDEQKKIADEDARRAVVTQLQERLLTKAYTIPLFGNERTVVLSKHLKGWHFIPSHMMNEGMADMWLDNAGQ